jgi:hypothetical protein
MIINVQEIRHFALYEMPGKDFSKSGGETAICEMLQEHHLQVEPSSGFWHWHLLQTFILGERKAHRLMTTQ